MAETSRHLSSDFRRSALDRFFKFFGRAEGNLFASLDLNGSTRCGVTAHARGALAHLKNAETADADALAFFQVLDDVADQSPKDGFGLLLRNFIALGERCRKVLQSDGSGWLGCHETLLDKAVAWEMRRLWRCS